VRLPPAVRDEIESVARRTHRSLAFIARRALSTASRGGAVGEPGPRVELVLTVDEDDPPDTALKVRALAGTGSLDDALLGAWIHARARFLAWAAREEAASAGERADALDLGLALAADPGTAPARLRELVKSEYPKVRVLLAAHPRVPEDAQALLSSDREPQVRKALLANPAVAAALKASIRAD
jgi:hypothetical protein